MTLVSVVNQTDFQLLDGHINNYQTVQTNVNHTSIVNISGQVMDEFNNTMGPVVLYCQYFNATDGNWYSGQDIHGNNAITTDSNGFFDIQVNLDQTPDLGLVQWMMNCSEIPNCVMDFNQTLNITTNSFNDQMFMSVTFDYLSVNTINLFTATITNIGNSTLENIQIAIWNFTSDTTGNKFTGTIIPGEISLQTTLLPGQVYTFEIQITSSNYNVNLANFTVNANATSLESNQSVTS